MRTAIRRLQANSKNGHSSKDFHSRSRRTPRHAQATLPARSAAAQALSSAPARSAAAMQALRTSETSASVRVRSLA